MAAPKRYVKLFFDFETAKRYGEEVDAIAKEITVPAGRNGKPYRIFRGDYVEIRDEHDEVSFKIVYFSIETKKGIRNQEIYYIKYEIDTPTGASKADMIQAIRQVEEVLKQKYQKLMPDSGISHG